MSGVTRRGFLVGAAGAAVALGAAKFPKSLRSAGSRADERAEVVVIGAGFAGLVAAEALTRAGRQVTVLEARNRVGGRVQTVRWGALHAEAGGEFVDRAHTQMRRLVDRLGLSLETSVPRSYRNLDSLVLFDDRVVTEDRLDARAGNGWDRFEARLDALSDDIDPRNPLVDKRGFDSRSAASLIDQVDPDRISRFMIEAMIRNDFGVDAPDLSLLALLSDWATGSDVGGEEAFRVRGGADRIATRLAARLAEPVRLSTPVRSVTIGAKDIVVTHDGGSITADRCILAIPLPAARSITGLPAEIAAAAQDIEYANVVKVLRRYDRRIWKQRGRDGDFLTEHLATWDGAPTQQGPQGILIGYAAGSDARVLAAKPVKERAAELSRTFAIAERGSVYLADRFASRAWGRQRYSGGAWISYAPGQMTKHYRAVHGSYGRLHLAGEHTAQFAGYMEGAVRSGLNAAAEIAST